MQNFQRVEKNLLIVCITIVGVFFLISLSGIIYAPWDETARRIANRDFNGEGLIEHIEAISWIISAVLLAIVFFKTKLLKFHPTRVWILFFSVFCFFAFGEELSWGFHIFNFETSIVTDYNYQEETNIHNLNLSEILNISPDNFLYPYLLNFTYLLNPLFYIGSLVLWSVIPYLKKKNYKGRLNLLKWMPVTFNSVAKFCGTTIIFFLIFDRIFFDVGELIELSISLTALMFSTNIYIKYKKKHGSTSELIESWINE